jgi:hypothetical protein
VYDGGKRIGEVCDGCYPSDEQALRQRLRERAALLRTTAANMEADANGEIVMPTTDDWITQLAAYQQAKAQAFADADADVDNVDSDVPPADDPNWELIDEDFLPWDAQGLLMDEKAARAVHAEVCAWWAERHGPDFADYVSIRLHSGMHHHYDVVVKEPDKLSVFSTRHEWEAFRTANSQADVS